MRTLTLLSLLLVACEPTSSTKYVTDRDEDGIPEEEDCNDEDNTVGQPTTYYADLDHDGHGDADTSDAYCERPVGYVEVGDDCDDADADVYPGNTEVCDGKDNDCDGSVDNGAESTVYYADVDGDGYGDDASVVYDCWLPEGYAEVGGDCNDADAAYNPAAPEEDCEDPNDYNCDGSVGYADNDADGFAACAECDDANGSVFPGADESCNDLDDDCDGEVDEAGALDEATWYADLDGDGYGDPATAALACDPGPGWVADASDCDDSRADVNPSVTEVCNDYDDDCDGLVDDADDSLDSSSGSAWYTDGDNDGYGSGSATWACDALVGSAALDGDCDDTDPAYNPGATEADCADPNDYNCDGSVGYADDDGDGYAACEECDDSNAANNPAATEVCDGQDNDCDGEADESDAADATTWYADADNDGYGNAADTVQSCTNPGNYTTNDEDCDDTNDAVNPSEVEVCNGVDDNCDGEVDEDAAVDASTWYADADGDGYGDAASTAVTCSAPAGFVADDTDCDDTASGVNPAATEYCDGIDNNCDGAVDEDAAIDASTWYVDADADGYGDATVSVVDCSAPAGYVLDDSDCDDATASTNPGAGEYCNGADDDCDGTVDEDSAVDASTWYADADGDSFGNAASTTLACAVPSGYVGNDEDCDDGDAAVNPDATELCDSIDNNCDGAVDEDTAADASTWYADADGDSFGNAASTTLACAVPSGYVGNDEDCDDGDDGVNPDATEVCDSIDNDCDGTVDEDTAADAETWYADADGDSFGDGSSTAVACAVPSGYVGNDEDCDDGDAAVNPDATELCDGIDNDCDGSVDEDSAADASTWYLDADGDNYGDAANTTLACSVPSGYVSNDDDCDDTAASVYPGATEYCNGEDDDCDGSTDEDSAADALTWYADADSDGYGNASSTTAACEQPSGYVSNDEDCDDTDADVSPAGTETCNGIDDDCDGTVDEDSAVDASTWYADADGDGYGNASSTYAACSVPSGYVSNDDDCDDSLASVSPAGTETCNYRDDDCDGSTDEAGSTGETTYYADDDGDGYGDASVTESACTAPSGYVSNDDDCDDGDEDVNPGETETCNTIDDDCDGDKDETGCPATCTVEEYGDHVYMYCESTLSWSNARLSCLTYGYDLVTINDDAENTWLVTTSFPIYYGKWWTGYNDQTTEGTWEWANGESATYTNWHSGEPNNVGNEDCMQLGRFLDYTWNDEPCTSTFRYICEE